MNPLGLTEWSLSNYDTPGPGCVRSFGAAAPPTHGCFVTFRTRSAWDARTGRLIKSFFGQHAPGTWPHCLALSSDGRWLVSGSRGPFGATSVKLWAAHASGSGSHGGGTDFGTCAATFAHLEESVPGAVTSVALDLGSSGRIVVYTGASDGTIAAWRVEEREAKRKTTRAAIAGFLNNNH